MKQALIMTTTCLLFCASALANTQYEDASKYADSVKGKGMDTLKGTDPSAVIPGIPPVLTSQNTMAAQRQPVIRRWTVAAPRR